MIGVDARVRRWSTEAGDDERLRRMFDRLSPETRWRRFFTAMPVLDSRVFAALTSVDHVRHEAFVALVGDEMVALASYHRRADDPAFADVAVVVEDDWQHHGLARRLMRQLVRTARAHGVQSFHADVLADNTKAVGLIRRMARESAHGRLESGELEFDLPLTPAA